MNSINYKISIVIPLYNERENVRPLYDMLEKLDFFEWEAIVVDDGSSDGTWDELRFVAQNDSRVKLIRLRKNYGQTAAMTAGFDACNNPIIISMDGDLQNDPYDIPKLLHLIDEGYDVVSGWRKDRWKRKFFSRRLPSILANILISHVTGIRLHDYGCTLKAYKREVLAEVRLYGEMHRFIPAFAAWHGARVAEVAVNDHERIHGITKYGMGRIIRVIMDLVTVKFLMGYSTKPMHFFGRAGFLSFLVSLIATMIAMYWKFTGDKSFIQTPLPLFAALFFIIGVQFFLMGLVAEMITRNYYESADKKIYHIKDSVNIQ